MAAMRPPARAVLTSTRVMPGICVSASRSGFFGRLHFHANFLAAFELRGEILRRVHGGDFALVDDHHAVAGHADFRKNVRGENDGVVSGEALDQVADFDDLLGIEADGGLVEDDDVGIVDQSLRDAYALLVAARETLDQLVALVFQVGLFDRVGDAGGALVRRDVLDARDEIQIIARRSCPG